MSAVNTPNRQNILRQVLVWASPSADDVEGYIVVVNSFIEPIVVEPPGVPLTLPTE